LNVKAEEEAASGSSIAHDFIDALTSHFTQALPIVVGFLVLVFATVVIIRLVQRFLWERQIDEYNRGERDSVG
jgi:hypothetical protein